MDRMVLFFLYSVIFLALQQSARANDRGKLDGPRLGHSNQFEYNGSGLWSIRNSMALDEDVLYIACLNGLQIVDISNPETPSLLCQVYLAENPKFITVSNDLLFVGPVEGSTVVYDVTDSQKLVEVTRINSVGRVSVDGHFAFLLNNTGIQVYDISSVNTPLLVGSEEFPIQGHQNSPDLEVADGIAYCVGWDLSIVDVSQPSDPNLIATIDLPELAVDVTVSGAVAYVACLSNIQPSFKSNISVVDVSNPQVPVIDTSIEFFGDVRTVKTFDEKLYAACGQNGIAVFDISVPSSPHIIGCYPPSGDAIDILLHEESGFVLQSDPGIFAGQSYSLDLCTQLGLISDVAVPFVIENDTAAILVLNVNECDSISLIGLYGGEFRFCNTIGQFNDHVIAGDELGHMYVVDVMAEDKFSVVSTFTVGHVPTDIVQLDNALYIACLTALYIVDCSNLNEPTLIDSLPANGTSAHLALYGNHAYWTNGFAGTKVLSVSDVFHPVVITSLSPVDHSSDLTVARGVLYVADGFGGISAYELADPANPLRIDEFNALVGVGFSNILESTEDYLISSGGALSIIGISDPDDPLKFATIDVGSVYDLEIDGELIYAACAEAGVYSIDITTPDSPFVSHNYDTPGLAVSICRRNLRTLVADYGSLIRLANPMGTDVNEENENPHTVPREFNVTLFPNPASSIVNVKVHSSHASRGRVKVYNILGQIVDDFEFSTYAGDERILHWDGNDLNNTPAPSGVYFLRVDIGDRTLQKKLIMLKK